MYVETMENSEILQLINVLTHAPNLIMLIKTQIYAS